MPAPLPQPFFARDADVVARDLLGCVLVHETPDGPRAGRVVETEAYFGPPLARSLDRDDWQPALRRAIAREGDPASHAARGPTPRSAVMFGPAGRAYVYLIYGMHECLNVTTGPEGEGQAVLLRALAPVASTGSVAEKAASGPGRLTRALGVTRALNGAPLDRAPLFFLAGEAPARVARSRRVNVVGGEAHPFRFYDASSASVSRLPPRPAGRRA